MNYLIKFDEKGYRADTQVVEEKLEEEMQDYIQNGYTIVPEEDYQLLIGNVDGQVYVKDPISGAYTPEPEYVPKLEELKQAAITEQYNKYNTEKYKVVWLTDGSGYGFDTDKDSQIDWLAVREVAASKPETPIFYRVWLSPTEKGFVQVTKAQLDEAGELSQKQQQSAYVAFEEIKMKIEACQTKEELEALITGER